MPVQITIIGLGRTGASLGLALAAYRDKVFVTGHDKEFSTERLAKQKGAVDATNHNLPASVEHADLILLAVPVHQVRETFGYIARDVKKDAVVVDLCPVKTEVAKWAMELLPSHCHYVGVVPVIGAGYLRQAETGADAARADLFLKSVFMISAPSATPGAALKLVSDFVELLGATAMMTDFIESDGLMTSAHLLPQLTAASLIGATVGQPGWQEVRKVAGVAYYAATSAFADDSDVDALHMSSMHNRGNVVRGLDRLIASLIELRDDIEEGNGESLKSRLQTAQRSRQEWLDQRGRGDWTGLDEKPVEKLTFLQRMFGSRFGESARKDG